MNINTSSQHQGVLAWAVATSNPIDLRYHVHFSFTFEVIADLVADAVFNVQSAPPDEVDPCIPGVFVPVEEVLTCRSLWGAQGGPQATIVLPAGAKKGSICSATLPCKPDAFVKLIGSTGPVANVRAVAVLSGPK